MRENGLWSLRFWRLSVWGQVVHLFRFLLFISSQQNSEVEKAAATAEEAKHMEWHFIVAHSHEGLLTAHQEDS